jgi:hypothetical protein
LRDRLRGPDDRASSGLTPPLARLARRGEHVE